MCIYYLPHLFYRSALLACDLGDIASVVFAIHDSKTKEAFQRVIIGH